ncbi:MAG: hypothetical protein OSA99_17650, partial [Acidimicrobiales bacterium]|nr:hypothetical protein [Acidimicrobiales bacterium]
MEVRDAMTDFLGSIRPRARPAAMSSDAAAGFGAVVLVGLLIALSLADAGSHQQAPAVALALVALGLVVAATLWVAADSGTGRLVRATRVVPLIVGIVYLAPTTMVLVAALSPVA